MYNIVECVCYGGVVGELRQHERGTGQEILRKEKGEIKE